MEIIIIIIIMLHGRMNINKKQQVFNCVRAI